MPRRLTDEDYRRKFADFDKRARQIEARRDQLTARRAVDERQRMTRAKRVLGEAVLRWLDAHPTVLTTLSALLDAHVAELRDREVVAWAASRTAAPIELGIVPVAQSSIKLSRARQPENLDAVALADWRKTIERARIVLGGAVLRRIARCGDRPFLLSALILEDLVRRQDAVAVRAVIQGI